MHCTTLTSRCRTSLPPSHPRSVTGAGVFRGIGLPNTPSKKYFAKNRSIPTCASAVATHHGSPFHLPSSAVPSKIATTACPNPAYHPTTPFISVT